MASPYLLDGGPLRFSAAPTFENALTNTTGVVRWGGNLTQHTIVYATAGNYDVIFGNTSLALPNLLYVNGAGISLGVGSSTYDPTNPERLLVQAGTASSVNVISGYADADSYRQISIKHNSTGTSASGEFTATADTGDETTNFLSVGINSSTYSDPAYNIGGALDAYVFNNGGNLTIGTQTAAEIRFHTAGTTSAEQRAVITSTGRVGIGATAPGTTFNNQNSTSNQTDGTTAVAASGLGWEIDGTGYAAAIVNAGVSGNNNGLLVRVADTNGSVARFLYNSTTLAMDVGANGYIGIGTNIPVCVLSNSADGNDFIDDLGYTVGADGFGWASASSIYSYAAAIVNKEITPGIEANGLLVKIQSPGDDLILHLLGGDGAGGTPISRMAVLASGRVGINQRLPVTTFNNQNTTSSQTDGTSTLAGTGLGWQIADTGYGMAVSNTTNGSGANGLLVRVARSASDASIARFLYNGTTSAMTVLANGNVGFGGAVAPGHVLTNSATAPGAIGNTVSTTAASLYWESNSNFWTAAIRNNAATNARGGLGVQVASGGATAGIIIGAYSGNTSNDIRLQVRTDGTSYARSDWYFNPPAIGSTSLSLAIGASATTYPAIALGVNFDQAVNQYIASLTGEPATMIRFGGQAAATPFEIMLGGTGTAGVAVTFSPIFQAYRAASVNYLSFFGVTPVVRQTGGAATASGTYGATEQTMLNAVYSALRNYGLLT